MKKSTLMMAWLGLLVALAGVAPLLAQGQISSPRDRATVRGLVPIEGSATHPQFEKFEVHFGPEPNPGDQWTPIQGSPFFVPVVQGRLGLWDTTIIPDGLYSLRLRIVRSDGNYDEYFVRGILVANTRPTDTPAPQATPTPAAPTQTPSPTPTVLIAVPSVASPTPPPTITPLPTTPPTATPEPAQLPFGISGISDAACWSAGITLGIFVGIGLLFALKGGLAALVRSITGRGSEDAGV